MFQTRKDTLSIKEIKDLVQKHGAKLEKYKNLQDYYMGVAGASSIKNAYPKYITDVLTGYFMGVPVTYSSDNEKLIERLLEVFKYNDEADHNVELAKLASIKGMAYELLYLDDDAKVRFFVVDPAEMFTVTDASLERRLKYAVRYYKLDDVYRLEVYDKERISYYEGKDIEKAELVDEQAHYFADVPVSVYENNKERQGDFEQVLGSIEAYNAVQDTTLGDMKMFSDAYLMLAGMLATDSADIAKLKKEKVLLLPEGGKAEWLIKSVNDAWVENYKNRLRQDIHKFSFTPDLSDEHFGSNLSGVSLSYKLLAMEQLRGVKEGKFKKGLSRRIELICNVLKITSAIDDYTAIDMQFNNTLPRNIYELSQTINNLAPHLSQETLLSRLPFVDDVAAEIQRKRDEQKAGFESEYVENA